MCREVTTTTHTNRPSLRDMLIFANIALTFGDRFVPPIGSKVCLFIPGEGLGCYMAMIVEEHTEDGGFVGESYDVTTGETTGNVWTVHEGTSFYIDELPINCPDFRDWVRIKPLEETRCHLKK